jgi:uncharacterized protein (TIGR02145 family)
MNNNDYVVINGLKWDRENLTHNGETLFTHQEALDVAKKVGKRLPTCDEWEDLIALGCTWDHQRKGMWFGTDHREKDNSRGSIFLPAAGFRYYSNGTLYCRGSYGYYWSTRMNNATSAYYVYFNSGGTSMYNGNRTYGLSVRCIAE